VTRKQYRRLRRAMPWAVLTLLLVIWQGFCVAFHVPTVILPSPSDVLASLLAYYPIIAVQALQTLTSTLLGFGVAAVLGLLVGMLIGASGLVYSGLYGLLVAFNSVPKVALVPVFVIWFGIGTIPAILTAFSLAFFPIVVNVATGLATIEPEWRDVLRSMGAREDQILLKIGLPRVLPFFFGSLKVAVTLAFVGSITSETIASNNGIGYLMMSASSQFNVALVFAGVVVVGVLGVVMYAIFSVFEERMTGWARRSAA
jgi:NitT/TauT family transport system permease protein